MKANETIIDLTKMTRPAAIKLAMKVFRCTQQQAKDFVALSRKETAGDVVRGDTDEEEFGASRTKEAGGAEEVGVVLEDGEEYARPDGKDGTDAFGGEA